MPFWIDFCLIFDPNLPPKIHQNRSKIDAKMPSHVDFVFWSIFDWFWLPTSTPWTLKITVFPEENEVFKNSRFEVDIDFWSILVPTCIHFPFRIHQNPSKNRSQDASLFRSIFVSIFLRFSFDFGGQLGAMLATFSLKIRRGYLTEGWFLLGLSSFSIFWASWPPLGALWARFGRVRASILEVFGAHFLHIFQGFGSHFFSNLSPVLKHLLH